MRDLSTYEVNYSERHLLAKKMVNWKKIVDNVSVKINQRGSMVEGEWMYEDSENCEPHRESQSEHSEDKRL